jgi:hypothetical protein
VRTLGLRDAAFLARVTPPASVGLDPDAVTYIAAMTVPPDSARQTLISNLIAGLKTDGVWSKIGALYLLAAHDSQAALINAKTPGTATVSAVNSPVFTVDRGYAGDGISAHLNTNTTHSAFPQMSLDSQHLFYTQSLPQTNTNNVIGLAGAGSTLLLQLTASSVGIRIGSASSFGPSQDQRAARGILASRQTAGSFSAYVDGGAEQTFNASSSSMAAVPVALLRAANSYSDARLSSACFGAGLNSAEAAALYSRINTFLTAIGA